MNKLIHRIIKNNHAYINSLQYDSDSTYRLPLPSQYDKQISELAVQLVITSFVERKNTRNNNLCVDEHEETPLIEQCLPRRSHTPPS